jgi:hypothetical protein
MKYTLIISFTIIAISFGSCSKENNSANSNFTAIQNKDVYFTISFSGKTLTSYGIKFLKAAGYADNDFIYSLSKTFTDLGQTYSTFYADIRPTYSSTPFYGESNIKDGQVSAEFWAQRKVGQLVGTFAFEPNLGGPTGDPWSSILDRSTQTKYYIDPSGSQIVINSVDQSLIKGTFSCKLISGTNRIPATGTFSLHK